MSEQNRTPNRYATLTNAYVNRCEDIAGGALMGVVLPLMLELSSSVAFKTPFDLSSNADFTVQTLGGLALANGVTGGIGFLLGKRAKDSFRRDIIAAKEEVMGLPETTDQNRVRLGQDIAELKRHIGFHFLKRLLPSPAR